MDPLIDHEVIADYLGSLPRQTVARGRDYFFRGNVAHAEVVKAGAHYRATVRGSEEYAVDLFFEEGGWVGDCTCPMEIDCKHCVAALLSLQSSRKGAGASPHVTLLPAPANPQPVAPFQADVEKALKRALTSSEIGFLKRLIRLHADLLQSRRQLSAYDLHALWQGQQFLDCYGFLDLWETPPAQLQVFWQYCAKALSDAKAPIPAFLQPVTHLDLIAAPIAAYQRKKVITAWQDQLEVAQRSYRLPQQETLDLRVQLTRQGVTLLCRASEEDKFKPMKASQVRRISYGETGEEVLFTPKGLLVWGAAHRYLDELAGNWEFGSRGCREFLSQMLRWPHTQELVQNGEGLPLPRASEPLHWSLLEPESLNGDYRLQLVVQGTKEPVEVLCYLPGKPPLYLTPTGIHEGPEPSGLGKVEDHVIPAPALESQSGLQLLCRLGVPLPARLEQQVQRVKSQVTATFKIAPLYPGAQREAVFARVVSLAPGEKQRQLGSSSWYCPSENTWNLGQTHRSKPAERLRIVDRTAETYFPTWLEKLGAKPMGYTDFAWRMNLTRDFAERFLDWLKALPPEITVELDPELATLRESPVSAGFRLDVEETGVDWFDLQVSLDLDAKDLTPEELKLLLNAKGKFVRLGKKGWRRLEFHLTPEEDESLAKLGLNPHDFNAEPQKVHALQLADAAAAKFLPPEQVEAIQRRAEELKVRVAPDVPSSIQATLRPYQVEGYHFLSYLASNRFGGILADDMGLGKTLQALAWIQWLRAQADRPKVPSLVVCPKSVMENWRMEAERFSPGLRVRLWAGETADTLPSARRSADLVVVNYAQLRNLSPEIASHPWHVSILDEAQYIKNPDAQTAQAARALRASHRLALTGTPIENRLLDLWSIMAYAMPGVLGNRNQFVKRFQQKDDPLARQRLAGRVRPFLIRRTKGQVAKDLPDRTEEDILCELEGRQKTLYRAEYKRARQMLLRLRTNQDLNAERFNFLTMLLRLRQICCHPALLGTDFAKEESAKVSALVDLLEPLMAEGHKVLVFSQFVGMLQILKEVVEDQGWRHFYLAGETENRGDLVKEFQEHEGEAVFLISLKAGGFGLNLTAASYVVLFDPWWNPAVENQAIDRTHRIGQTSNVIAYRLLMKDSIEEKIRSLQKQKASLADAVLGEETFARSLSLEDLRFLFDGV